MKLGKMKEHKAAYSEVYFYSLCRWAPTLDVG